MTVPQKPLDIGRLQASLGRLILETGVHGQDNCVISVLEYVDRQSRGEALRGGMELVDHSVAPPPPHEAYCVRIHLGQEDIHGPYCAEGVGADVNGHAPDVWACRCDGCEEGGGDIGAAEL